MRRISLRYCGDLANMVPLFIFSIVMGLLSWDSLPAQPQNKEIVEKVMLSPDVPIRLDNLPEAPLVIQNASVKVIASAKYHTLVGSRDSRVSTFSQYTTFPTVTLINTTNQRVISFSLLLNNRHEPGQTRFVKITRFGIDPDIPFTVEPFRWVHSRVQSMLSNEDGADRTMKVLHSPVIWLPGGANDLVVRVGMVRFEDGKTWHITGEGSR